MLSVLFYCSHRPGMEEPLRALVKEMTRVSREEDGAITYTFHQQKDDRGQWMLYEQWRDRAHLKAHHASMYSRFGEPPPGAELPARMHALVESYRVVWYEAVA